MMRRVAAFATRLYLRLFQMTLGAGYRSAFKTGPWRDELIESAAPRAGERIFDVSAEGFSSCAELARRYPTAHFAAAHPKTTASSGFVTLTNLEHLPCCEGRIQASGASFDKVVCALALHNCNPMKRSRCSRKCGACFALTARCTWLISMPRPRHGREALCAPPATCSGRTAPSPI